MKFLSKPPCGQCPFRKTSLQGYLGPETVESIQPFVHGELPWVCHTSIAGKPSVAGFVDTTKYGHACRGAIICATKSHKLYKPGPLRKLQDKLESSPAVGAIMNWWEFAKYHREKAK